MVTDGLCTVTEPIDTDVGSECVVVLELESLPSLSHDISVVVTVMVS